MKNLCAPWRIGYIRNAHQDKGCFLCSALKARQDDRHMIVARLPKCFAIMNKFPYNGGHLLVSPNEHVGELEHLSPAGLRELFGLTVQMKCLLAKIFKPQGFNIGINLGASAGAGLLGHVHVHVVPRWVGDTNFMPVMGSTKVLPQALEELYGDLKREWDRAQGRRPRTGRGKTR
ncbi:MAG: HIT domain-containing protein, partial [Planctomycetota bacterium]|nr:HIT domain-containing protein [Planctomycetota bacterium]